MTAIDDAADRLRAAAQAGRPCAPVRDMLAVGAIGDAYAVQQVNIQRALGGG